MGVWKAYRTSTVRHNHLDVLRTREYAMAHACYASKDDKFKSVALTAAALRAVLVSWAHENWNYWVAASREDQLISYTHRSSRGRA